MTLIDTHCHLHFPDFDADRDAVIDRARAAGVRAFVNVGTDPETNQKCYEIARLRPFITHTVGLHPHHAHEVKDGDWNGLERFIEETRPCAIGEVGLDYFKSEAPAAVQKNVFARLLALAVRYRLPVIVHSRNAFDDTLEVFKAEAAGRLRAVMHCFSYDKDSLKRALDCGLFASFTCNITFKNAAALLETAQGIPLDRLMLETDSPYLAPQSHRGKRNEPAHLAHLASFLAEARHIGADELAAVTTRNAVRFFGLEEAQSAGE